MKNKLDNAKVLVIGASNYRSNKNLHKKVAINIKK